MNIAEILKKCPKGTKLYSPLFGDVELVEAKDDLNYSITCSTTKGELWYFADNGKFYGSYPSAECMLFPSKDQRDWSKFIVPDQVNDQKPKTELKPFDKVLVRDSDDREWGCDFFSHLGDKKDAFYCIFSWWKQCIPYEGNEHLLGTKNNPEK